MAGARDTLVTASEVLARLHNALGVTKAMPEQARQFFGRPFRVMALHGFAEQLLRTITDPPMQALVQRPPIGAIDHISDNTDLLENPIWQSALWRLYLTPDASVIPSDMLPVRRETPGRLRPA